MLSVYASGVASTSELIRRVGGHPEAVIQTIRLLEEDGILSRVHSRQGRHPMETRLTLRGLVLVETPLSHWSQVFRKWNGIPHPRR